jgi:small subunit ribosomal protein S4
VARYTGPVCRLCRRDGVKLFLKGDRCFSSKCSLEKTKTIPGQHGPTARKGKMSGYGIQLREKQKLKRWYGVLEGHFRNVFRKASLVRHGTVAENLVYLLELRLDSVLYRAGFLASKSQARQLIGHKHVMVNGSRCNIASARLKIGDVLSLDAKAMEMVMVKESMAGVKKRGMVVPSWFQVDYTKGTVQLISKPVRDEIQIPVKEQSIVELYSK